MKKNFKYFGIVWLIGFIIFNAVTFLVPNEVFGITRFNKPTFWIAYSFITLSFLIQLATAYKVIRSDDKEKTFLNVPLITTGYRSIIVSFIVGLVFMVFPILPAWIGAIVCILITGYFVIACVKATAAADIVAEVGEKVRVKTQFIRMARLESENILARATTEEIKSQVKKVYEALKYSDPMSSDFLTSVESNIGDYLSKLQIAVVENDEEKVISTTNELLILIKERNNKCKALK